MDHLLAVNDGNPLANTTSLQLEACARHELGGRTIPCQFIFLPFGLFFGLLELSGVIRQPATLVWQNQNPLGVAVRAILVARSHSLLPPSVHPARRKSDYTPR